MAQQINIFLLLLGTLQGGLLCLWFLQNQRQEPANRYLGFFLLIVGLQLILKVITKVWLVENVRLLYLLSYQLPYLVGPLLFLYVQTKRTGHFRRTDAWHFVPFCLVVMHNWVLLLVPELDMHVPAMTSALLQSISLVVYTYLAYRRSTPDQKWFIRLVAGAEWIIILTLALMVRYYGLFPDVRLLFGVLTVLIYWISYRVIARSAPFAPSDQPPVGTPLQKNPKYAHSSLKPEEADRIEALLQRVMVQEKRFLDPGLTIDTLAEKLSTNRHHLSQVLNERLGQTYSDYISGLRLEEARQRLSNPAHFRHTIAAIALDSGFNSVSSFNDVFRKRYGITPSKFREPFIKK